MYTALLWTIIGIVTASMIFAVSYIAGFAYTAGTWSFQKMRRHVESIRAEQSGAFVCTTHLCAIPCPRPDATCSWSSKQEDVDAVRTVQGEKDGAGFSRDAP